LVGVTGVLFFQIFFYYFLYFGDLLFFVFLCVDIHMIFKLLGWSLCAILKDSYLLLDLGFLLLFLGFLLFSFLSVGVFYIFGLFMKEWSVAYTPSSNRISVKRGCSGGGDDDDDKNNKKKKKSVVKNPEGSSNNLVDCPSENPDSLCNRIKPGYSIANKVTYAMAIPTIFFGFPSVGFLLA